jgi:hypothetical protein
MFSLSDIFTPSFFIILIIVVLLIAILVIYIENKGREQNHKIASMLSLVSSLAEEINGMRFHLINGGGEPSLDTNQNNSILENNANSIGFPSYYNDQLIEVSDDEEDDDEEEEEDEDDEDDDDENENEENDDDDLKTTIFKLNISDTEDKTEIIEIGSENDIKVLKINDFNTIQTNNHFEDDMNSISDLETLESASEEKKIKDSVDLKSISFSLEENENDFKSLEIESQSKDIKRASLQTLRTLVIEKKLVSDPSKLKKQELLKLLGIE